MRSVEAGDYRKWILMALLPGLMGVFLFSQGQPAVNVDLGMIMDSFLPGDQVSVPIILVTRNEPQVVKISLEVSYPSEIRQNRYKQYSQLRYLAEIFDKHISSFVDIDLTVLLMYRNYIPRPYSPFLIVFFCMLYKKTCEKQ